MNSVVSVFVCIICLCPAIEIMETFCVPFSSLFTDGIFSNPIQNNLSVCIYRLRKNVFSFLWRCGQWNSKICQYNSKDAWKFSINNSAYGIISETTTKTILFASIIYQFRKIIFYSTNCVLNRNQFSS